MNLGAMHMSAHAGTHADAPLHVESSWGASETLAVRAFVGPARVITLAPDFDPQQPITRGLLEALLAPAPRLPTPDAPLIDAYPASVVPSRLLCRTGYSVSRGSFPDAWPALDAAAAAWLVSSGLRLWGTDAPSVDARESKDLPVHHALFGGGAYVLENLALDAVAAGHYELLAQPLALVGADAAPVRAMLRSLG